MSDERRHIVIVGGGAIGLSIACHLARLGIDDVLLLERDRLTSGSSWHAAGIVGPLRASMNLTRLAVYGLELFAELERETGQDTGYRQTGGVWLAQSEARMLELKRIKAMGDRAGLATEIINPNEIGARLPFVDCDGLSGGLWVEQDGQINPVDLCMAYARSARAGGVEIRENCRVSAIDCDSGRVDSIRLADGKRIRCDRLVLAAGAWSRELGRMAGIDIPLAACEHMYLVTDVVESVPRPCPIVRDLDAGIYLKGDAGKLVLGAFEANPKAWQAGPEDAGFLMFDEDWDHAGPMLEAGIRRAPVIADSGVTHFMNGPECFTPDTRQIMGAAPGCHNLYVAAGFNSIGIMSSAGVGKVMAQWIRDDMAPLDLWEVDILRFDPKQNDRAYLDARLPEAVHNQFAMHWPYKQFETGRDLRRAPWHDRLAAEAAVFGATAGWERPMWFAASESESVWHYGYAEQHWWPMARREALHCQRALALFELSPFGKIDIRGPDALALLQRLCSNDIDIEPGRVRYSLMLNRRGGIEAEITLTRLEPDYFRLVGAAATRFKDLDWLRRHCNDDERVEIADVTDEYAVAGLMGPGSRALLQSLAGDDFSDEAFPFARARIIDIRGLKVLAQRLSYVGELGWELYAKAADASEVMQLLLDAGKRYDLAPAGHFALDCCRLEVGFRHWGHDMGPEDTPLECGLEFAVDYDKGADFIGRETLLAQRRDGCRKRLRLCEVQGEAPLLLHDEPVYHGSTIVGHCTSGGQGMRVGKTLAFVMFYDFDTLPKAGLEIDIAGLRYPLALLDKPPYRAKRT